VSALRPLLQLAWRESRFARRRLLLFLSAISLGVAALVATQGFAANLAEGVREQSRALAGADLTLSSRRKLGPRAEAAIDSFRRRGLAVARVTEFSSMALLERTGGTRLSQVRAVEPGYPFYGQIVTAPAGEWAHLQEGRNALVDPALLTALDARVGDSISLGDARFRVAGSLEKVPGAVGIGALFAPRVFVPARYLAEMNLLRFGARVEYSAYVRMAPRDAAAFASANRVALRRERTGVDTAEQQQRQLARALGRLGDFLALVGTFALLLGGIGVASAMGAYMAQKRETVAGLRCLGATSRQVIVVYLAQAGVMGLVGASLGAAAGLAVQWVIPRLLAGLLPIEIETAVDARSLLTGIGIGVWIALAFALLPLLATRRISPLEALRRRVETGPVRRDRWTLVAGGILAASVAALVLLQAGSLQVGIGFVAGIAVSLLGLWLVAWVVTRLARRAPVGRLSYPLRQGLANLHRPGNQTRVVVLALGFGVFLLATLWLSQANLLRPLQLNAAASRANLLVFDVQDDQRAGVEAQLRAEHARVAQSAPIIPMRIYAINGTRTSQLPGAAEAVAEGDEAEGPPPDSQPRGEKQGPSGEPRPGGGWALRREYRSTFRDTVNASETLLQGRFWSPGRSGAEVSLDHTIMDDLGVKLGDQITWDVQGVRIATRITSVREVDWQRLEPNFFAVFPSAVLRDAPQTWVLLAEAPGAAARARVQRDVVRRYPNVGLLDLSAVQAALDEVVGRVAAVIRFLAAFSVATGFIVLLGAVLTSRLQRVRESVLLRTLGATRRQVAAILLTENLTLGLMASLTGIGLATLAGWALASRLFKVGFGVPVLQLLLLAAGVTLLAGAVGAWGSREVFRHTPLESLREE
jgi:putative ABC transport system permease protein